MQYSTVWKGIIEEVWRRLSDLHSAFILCQGKVPQSAHCSCPLKVSLVSQSVYICSKCLSLLTAHVYSKCLGLLISAQCVSVCSLLTPTQSVSHLLNAHVYSKCPNLFSTHVYSMYLTLLNAHYSKLRSLFSDHVYSNVSVFLLKVSQSAFQWCNELTDA